MTFQLTPDIQVNLRSRWAATAVFAYDTLLTADEEVGYVWKSEWSLPKALYLFSRYFGLGTSLITSVVSSSPQSNQFCGIFNPAQSLCITINVAVPDALLLMRVLALFPHRNWVRRSLLVIYTAMITLFLVLFSLESHIAVTSVVPDKQNYGCLGATGVPAIIQVDNLVPIVSLSFNMLMFILTLIAACPHGYFKMEFAPLVVLIIRDGTLYFALISFTYAMLVATCFKLTSRPGIEELFLPWTIAIGPIAACRLFLSLRGAVRKPLLETTVRTAEFDRPAFRVREVKVETDSSDGEQMESVESAEVV